MSRTRRGGETGEQLQRRPLGELRRLPLESIDVPHARIRRDLGPVEELAVSLATVGQIHPVQVYSSHGRFRLVAGERRLQAARRLGWTSIDAVVREPSEDDLMVELVENAQRKWLTDAEEADALIRLVRGMGLEVKEVAAQVGRSEAYVSKRVRVFEDPVLRQAVERRQLPVSVAEEFLGIPASTRPALVQRAIEGGWEGWRVREAIRSLSMPAPELQPRPDEWSGTPEVEAPRAELRVAVSERMPRLAQQIRALERVLRDVRPFQLTPADTKALATLLTTLLRLARAHAGPGRDGITFPALADAEPRRAQKV
jgi:ParB family transcriptional regulator, chromosome partitioning protein